MSTRRSSYPRVITNMSGRSGIKAEAERVDWQGKWKAIMTGKTDSLGRASVACFVGGSWRRWLRRPPSQSASPTASLVVTRKRRKEGRKERKKERKETDFGFVD